MTVRVKTARHRRPDKRAGVLLRVSHEDRQLLNTLAAAQGQTTQDYLREMIWDRLEACGLK